MPFQVFLGAPTAKELRKIPVDAFHGQWETFDSSYSHPRTKLTAASKSSFDIEPFLPATLEAASRRISLVYQNAIFQDADEDEGGSMDIEEDVPNETTGYGLEGKTTMITWDATPSHSRDASRRDPAKPNATRSFLNTSVSARLESQLETQETQDTQSYDYSDTSSINRFPTFHFNLHSLTSLSALSASKTKGSTKVNMLLAILEAEGPDTITLKKGGEAGKEISVLKMILGDEGGSVCKLTAWREVAEAWGGTGDVVGVKRGDVILIQNVTAAYEPSVSPTLTASTYLKSKLEICYRTMPYTREDMRLRPDLRLGASDAAVRKVGAVVQWFERMAGL
ncbi:hypothetical protein V5O48_010429 [Marasmius crinis-equi]|uniref:Shieldin complex subunit 2 first OB fold domain-containing protein n=1 Tax=Marasmius crinis-equi TaxID=585013 RepID=A0ABR3F8E3_9AGAR